MSGLIEPEKLEGLVQSYGVFQSEAAVFYYLILGLWYPLRLYTFVWCL